MKLIYHLNSNPEIKLYENELSISYLKNNTFTKSVIIKIESLTKVEYKKHKNGIVFYLTLIFSIFSMTYLEYESNDEIILFHDNKATCFTFFKNLKKDDIGRLKNKLEQNNILFILIQK